jgi:hypothetical protein
MPAAVTILRCRSARWNGGRDEALGFSAAVSGPQGRANGLVGSTVHDHTSPSPGPGENYKVPLGPV